MPCVDRNSLTFDHNRRSSDVAGAASVENGAARSSPDGALGARFRRIDHTARQFGLRCRFVTPGGSDRINESRAKPVLPAGDQGHVATIGQHHALRLPGM